MTHLLCYWARDLFTRAYFIHLDAYEAPARDKEIAQHWAVFSDQAEMLLLIAEGAEVSRPVADAMIRRSLNAAREAAADFFDPTRPEEDRSLDYDKFYPWFIPGFFGTGGDDPGRAADLAALEEAVADRLGIPKSERRRKIELQPGERWY